jgi:serine/threonine protein kinase
MQTLPVTLTYVEFLQKLIIAQERFSALPGPEASNRTAFRGALLPHWGSAHHTPQEYLLKLYGHVQPEHTPGELLLCFELCSGDLKAALMPKASDCGEVSNPPPGLGLSLLLLSTTPSVHHFDGNVSPMTRLSWCRQLAEGLSFLHSRGIIHGGLRPSNVLILQSSGVRLADTGLTAHRILSCQTNEQAIETLNRFTQVSKGWLAKETYEVIQRAMSALETGTKEPSARGFETALAGLFSTHMDIFALGCLFYYILNPLQNPFGQVFMQEANIMNGHRAVNPELRPRLHRRVFQRQDKPDAPPLSGVEARSTNIRCFTGIPSAAAFSACDIISRMLAVEPELRPSARDVLWHPCFWTTEQALDYIAVFVGTLEARFPLGIRKDAPVIQFLVDAYNFHEGSQSNWETKAQDVGMAGSQMAWKDDVPVLGLLRYARTVARSAAVSALLFTSQNEQLSSLVVELRTSFVSRTQVSSLADDFFGSFPWIALETWEARALLAL